MRHKNPTIKDIALQLGVSVSTVSRALSGHAAISGETREKVREAADGLGYVVNMSARRMRTSSSLTVGLLVPDIRNDFYSSTAAVLAEHSRVLSFQVMLSNTGDDPVVEERQVRSFIEARVSGIVISPTPAPTETTRKLLRSVPAVQLLRRVPGLAPDAVCMEDAAGVRAATAYLLTLGHRRVAYAGTGEDISAGAERVRGYRQAHEAAGIAPDPSLIFLLPPTDENGATAARRILARKDRPKALVVGSTKMTSGVLRAVHEAGLSIPGDISLVGYGDPPWAGLLTPPLTTVALPVEAMARNAARLLFSRIMDEPDAAPGNELERLAPRLMVRGSAGPA